MIFKTLGVLFRLFAYPFTSQLRQFFSFMVETSPSFRLNSTKFDLRIKPFLALWITENFKYKWVILLSCSEQLLRRFSSQYISLHITNYCIQRIFTPFNFRPRWQCANLDWGKEFCSLIFLLTQLCLGDFKTNRNRLQV